MDRRAVGCVLCVIGFGASVAWAAPRLREGWLSRLGGNLGAFTNACWMPGVRCCSFPPRDTRTSMRMVEQALVSFQTDNADACPRSLGALVDEKYLTREPRDGWGGPLRFVCPGVHDPDGADLSSAGRDHKWGTADDLHSWDD